MNESRETRSGNRRQNLRLAALAIEFFSSILGLVVFGYLLDTYFHTTPWFGAGGLLLGMVLGVYRLIVGLGQLDH
jgi:F0F1-type ATP synthase assembly protein I